MTDEQINTAAGLLGVRPTFLANLERDLAAPVEPRPSRDTLRWPYEPMDDATWAVIAPIWGESGQAKVSSRAIVDALLMKATTGCPWDAVARYAPPEAARNQLKRRARSGALSALARGLRGKVTADQLAQFDRFAMLAGCQQR